MATKEKFEEAKRLYETANADQRYVLESLFPELKESEDERIRNFLISKMKEVGNVWKEYSAKDIIAWLEKRPSLLTKEKALKNSPFVEQKPAWSEEDDNCLSTIIAEFSKCAGKSVSKDEWMRCNDFLNSLRERVQPQLKHEWSEEDKEMLESCCGAVAAADYYTYDDKQEKESWLKSLSPQSTWKPSEGQLECLGYAIEKAEKDWSPLTNNRIYLTLKALKEQLLELRVSKV